MGKVINGFEIQGDFSSQNAGTCMWAYCSKEGHNYFIKKFLSPKFPLDGSRLSPATVSRKIVECRQFYDEKSRFYNALKCCRSGNIMIVTNFFREETSYYIVTDKIEGYQSDPGIIAQLSEDRKLCLIRSILYSVAEFHRQGIVHADIKPENMLLKKTRDGYYTAKIIDFDAGYFSGRNPEEITGDPVYLAPESYLAMEDSSLRLNQKVDIFALGILFHQYCAGCLPEIGKDYNYVFEAVLDGCYPVISGRVPAQLQDPLRRMLSKNPQSRPDAESILRLLAAGEERSETNFFHVPERL